MHLDANRIAATNAGIAAFESNFATIESKLDAIARKPLDYICFECVFA